MIDVNAAFQETLSYLMFNPYFSFFSPSGSCHLGRWLPAGRAACSSPPGSMGLSKPQVKGHHGTPLAFWQAWILTCHHPKASRGTSFMNLRSYYVAFF